jgi:L-alanine-DL-glutamate epimerase-like enolase superfamily enzyme
MKLEIERLEGVLNHSWSSAAASYSKRVGLRLRLSNVDGLMGFGEVAPLPGYSVEPLSKAFDELSSFELNALEPVLGGTEPAQMARENHELHGLSAAARCGLEMALLDLVSRARGVAMHRLFTADAAASVSAAALVPWGPSAIEHAVACVHEGATTLKVKLARDISGQLESLYALRAAVGPEVKLRLDANGAPGLAPADAARIRGRIAELNPEFVEEPGALRDPEKNVFPVALDESLQSLGGADELAGRVADTGASYVVLKPMLLGGLTRCHALALAAEDAGAKAVVSHLVDGPIAFAAYGHLACALSNGVAAGLGPHPGLQAFGAAASSGYRISRSDAPGIGVG